MPKAMKQEEVTTDKLLADLQAVVADAEALLKATAGHAGEKVQEARARAEESLAAARERLGEVHPWAAIGIAAGVGVLVGLLLGRR
jgi:ElaB/YqjD/DUF883 family membrane-anchored ribosome-binding protein